MPKLFNNDDKLVNGYHIIVRRYHWFMQNTANDSCGQCIRKAPKHFNRKWIEIIGYRPLRLKIWQMSWIELISNPWHSLPFIRHIKQFLHALLIFYLFHHLSISFALLFECFLYPGHQMEHFSVSNSFRIEISTHSALFDGCCLRQYFHVSNSNTHRMQLDQLDYLVEHWMCVYVCVLSTYPSAITFLWNHL